MHIRQLTAATTAFLRHPRTATIAFYVATAAIVLKLSPSILEFLGCSRTVLMDALYIIYESDTIRAALNLTAMLAMSVLWLVLSRMFPKEARLMRYTTFALAAMIALRAVWFMTESIFFQPVQALAQHDNATAISSMVTAIVGNVHSLIILAVSLLLTVRYRGRLRQLGIVIVAQFALSCATVLAYFALTSLHAGQEWAYWVSEIHLVLQSALSIIQPYFQWRAVRK